MAGRWVMHMLTVSLLVAAVGCDKGANTVEGEAGGEVDPTWSPQRLTRVKGVPAAQIRTALEARIAKSKPAPLDDDQWGQTRRLYKRYGNSPLWLAPDGLHEVRSKALTDAILNAHEDGLRMSAYPIGDLARALNALRQNDKPTADQLADVDLLLTATYVAVADDLLTGQVDPKSVSQSWYIDPQKERVDSALVRALREAPLDRSIARMRPQEDEYAALQKEMLRLREIAAKGEWPTVPSGRALKPGESDSQARLAALRARLQGESAIQLPPAPNPPASRTDSARGGQTPAAPAAIYDRALAGAIALFQARHGIPVDSILGEETVKSLNVSVRHRLGQIAANLERFRWLPRSLGSRYLLVNVPAFRVEGYDNGQKTIEMKVIVGAEYEGRATPVFSDSMEVVVFRPYWNVTPNIQSKELAPLIAADPGYMARGNYEYFTDAGQTRIRQRPGPKNSLGLVKFLFPNDFNIYLHDTPNDELFKKDMRALSHGCIRLEKPAEMAQWVLGWDAGRVDEAMQSDKDNRTVKLPKKIPVYITYFTTYVRDGQVFYGNDLYFRDDKLVTAMGEGGFPKEQTVQAVEALRRIAARD